MATETMRVLVVEPRRRPMVKEIETGLEALQKAVGGLIEAVYPFEEPVAIVCNEECKLLELPLNRALLDENGKVYDIIAGAFLVVGLTEDNFGSSVVYIGQAAVNYNTSSGTSALTEVTFARPAAEGTLQIVSGAFPAGVTLRYSGGGRYTLFNGDHGFAEGAALKDLNNKTLTWKSAYTITWLDDDGSVSAAAPFPAALLSEALSGRIKQPS